MWDPYPKNADLDRRTVDSFYNFLTANSDAEHDFLSKPWGLAEFGYVGSSQAAAYAMYDEARAQPRSNGVHPQLKAYIVWDNYTSSSHDDRVGFDRRPTCADPIEQQHYNAFANDPLLTGTAVPEPTDQTPPTVVTAPPRRTPRRSPGLSASPAPPPTTSRSSRCELLVDGAVAGTAAPDADGAVAFDWNSATRRQRRPHRCGCVRRDAAGNIGLSEPVVGHRRRTSTTRRRQPPTGPDRRRGARPSKVTLAWSAASDNARRHRLPRLPRRRRPDRDAWSQRRRELRRLRRHQPRDATPTPSRRSTPPTTRASRATRRRSRPATTPRRSTPSVVSRP